jgi:2-polyprenyl-3-methyl-5-hydroxy-6-metoxy-1,4-benzoquinol methylase
MDITPSPHGNPGCVGSPAMSAVPGTVAPGNTYDKVSTKNAVERFLVDGFASALDSLLPDKARRILDVGCGEGHHMRTVGAKLPEATVTGIDVADATWLSLWHAEQGGVATGDAAALPFHDDAFDLVMALEVLEHVPDPSAVLAEIARVASDVVIISTPWEPVWRGGNLLRGRYLGDWGNTPGHIQHFTRRKLVQAVGEHLEVEAVKRPLPWTFVRARAEPGRHRSRS